MIPTDNVQENATPEISAEAKPMGGRDEKGRFAKGNLGGPGNPFARQCAMARQVVHDAISLDDLRNMFEVVKRKALEGDIPSVKLILSYRVGRPVAVVDPETLDQQELQKYIDGHLPAATDVYGKVLNGMPIELLLNLLRILVPELTHNKAQTAAGIIKTPPAEQADQDDEFDDDEDDEPAEDVGPSMPPTGAAATAHPTAKGEQPDLLDRLRGKIKRPVTPNEARRPITNGSNGQGHPASPPMTNGANGKRGRKKNKKKRARAG